MRKINITLPLFLPDWLYYPLRWFKRQFYPTPTRNYFSERDVEWPFCAAHMPSGPGAALDFGCGRSPLGFLAALRGFRVTAIDLEPTWLPCTHPNLQFVQGDLFELALSSLHFDLIINCSSVEHVGLVGRYGVTESRPEGDLQAMALLGELMKPAGTMLLTIPIGQDTVLAPFHRVYGTERLPRLLQSYLVEHEEYWIKDEIHCWVPCDKEKAMSFQALGNPQDPFSFKNALGCFVLKRPNGW